MRELTSPAEVNKDVREWEALKDWWKPLDHIDLSWLSHLLGVTLGVPGESPYHQASLAHVPLSFFKQDGIEGHNMEVEEVDTDWPSAAPNPALTMQL
ncbi:hypothetical protein EYF80_007113 [Liparis tanakae]|uniref:Uncharacterized protein n=1 Tax=Liparis tanakae TaxID=230148 RepID=A0A4Z2IX98_9TELE|nr:hypothetical protein EYF80_007113 [Liparis tanakae]